MANNNKSEKKRILYVRRCVACGENDYSCNRAEAEADVLSRLAHNDFFSLSLDSICVCHVNRMLLFICMYSQSTLCYCFHLNQAENYNVLT